jgi:hypothetical protein
MMSPDANGSSAGSILSGGWSNAHAHLNRAKATFAAGP